MTSKERVLASLNHETPDRIPIDFGGTTVTGIHVQIIEKIRNYLGFEWKPVKIIEPAQMLGEVEDDVREALGIDTTSIISFSNKFGTKNDNWKEFRTIWGQVVLMPGDLNTNTDDKGNVLVYPQGDISAQPCAIMPKAAFFFDAITRQDTIDDSKLNPDDNTEEFKLITDDALEFWKRNKEHLKNSDRAVCMNFGGMALGDVSLVPGLSLKHPKGIRDVTEWYMSMLTRGDYIHKVFEKQTDIAIHNMHEIFKVIGNSIDILYMCGTDFGTQNSLFYPIETFTELYAPYYKKMNDWIHQNTTWKTFKHSCGAIEPLIQHIIDAGFDILNPVQISADGMDPVKLKSKYGDQVTFWGGGVDTQQVLSFGSPEDVKKQVQNQCSIFGSNGGFVFNTVHNIQANTSIENVMTMFETARKFNS